MKKILLTTLLTILAIPVTSFAASFDCTKAASLTEKLICGDEPISRLDEQLAASYKVALDKATDKDAFKKTQIEWLKQQRACKDVECLAKAYQKRLSELNGSDNSAEVAKKTKSSSAVGDVNGKKPLTFKLVFGDSYPICQPYVDMLNKTKYTEYPACERKILPEFSQFKAVEWKEITDKNEMIQTLKNLMDVEFAKMGQLNNDFHKRSFEHAKARIQSGETKLYVGGFDIGDDGDVETLYKETWFYAQAEVPKDCTTRTNIYVKDKKITVENAKEFYGSHYKALGMNGNNELFTIDKYIYSSHWAPVLSTYDIDIYGTDEKNNNTRAYLPVCGINIQ